MIKKIISFVTAILINCVAVIASNVNALDEKAGDSIVILTDKGDKYNDDYITGVSYSDMNMCIGETRKVRFYNSSTGMFNGLGRVEVNPQIMTYTYDEGSESVILKAVSSGNADIWIYEATCGIGANIKIKVINKPYTEIPTETSTIVSPDEKGNANCDDQVNMADAVFIMQCIANPDKYKFTEQGEKNADVDGSGDVTNKDALTIQLSLIAPL